MRLSVRGRAAAAAWLASSLVLAGCMGGGGESPPAAAAADPSQVAAAGAAATAPVPAEVGGPFGGSRYCPELRVRDGTEVLRRYENGHEDEAAFVQWQASIANTARQCRYDAQGNLTIRVGVSGRVIAGPKGGPGPVSAPLRIAVVKYQEAVLASQVYPIDAAIPPENSALFSKVQDVTVPSPGNDRDYIVYVGFDDGREVPVGNAPPAPTPSAREAAMEEASPSAEEIFTEEPAE